MSNKKTAPQLKFISGIPFPADRPDLLCHLHLFRHAPQYQTAQTIEVDDQPCVYTGDGRFEHAKIIIQILFPKKFEWHDWSDLLISRACEHEWLFVTGCGASSKSTSFGLYSLEWWMSDPLESAVIIASKTIDSAKKRIWREISRYYSLFSSLVHGYKDALITSSPRPQINPIIGVDRKKDESHGLFVTALHGKELDKEIGYIKGFHPRRILVMADELDVLEDGGKALIDTYTDNLRTGTQESQFIGMGNDPSLFNALGDMMQPAQGKPVSLEQHEWDSVKNVHCLRLDAWESPNIKHKDKFTGLVRQSDIDMLIARKGENSPSVYIQLHGIHPPAGAENTILSEATLIRFHCFDSVTWKTTFIPSASLDPAFGGRDACCFRTFKRGTDHTGAFRVFLWEIILLPIQATKDAEYEIATQVKALCISRSIPPEEFSIGSTGIGRGTAAVLIRQWSPRIVTVEENGAPSDIIVSDEDPRPANELYDRKVTELWFSIRQFVEADLIRGLDLTTATQLCSRTYEEKAPPKAKRSIQKKDEMLSSPNEADALAFYIHNLRLKGINATVSTPVKEEARESFSKAQEELDFDSSELSYSDPLLDVFP